VLGKRNKKKTEEMRSEKFVGWSLIAWKWKEEESSKG
jgi:hypothetical protein